MLSSALWGQTDDAARELLPVPGIVARAAVASPTRSPWIVANGWRFARQPRTKFRYELPAGKALLAAAERFAYAGDATLKTDPADAEGLRAITAFLETVPPSTLPPIADFAVVDDGSAVTGEAMNLLARRNLLYEIVTSPSSRFRLNVAIGTPEYPAADAADPSGFALKIRRQLTDEQRTLRIYGSEVVIARLTGDRSRIRLHLINYGGREIEGLRVRVRGEYASGDAFVYGAGRVSLSDHVVDDGATEFSLRQLGVYAVLDLRAPR
jgi:hypothetical protein